MFHMREYTVSLKKYELLFPPIWTWGCNQMTKQQAEDYFNWFISVVPERIRILEKVITGNLPLTSFTTNFTRNSLAELGKWLKENVTLTQKTDVETKNEAEMLSQAFAKILAKKGIPPYIKPGIPPVKEHRLSLEAESLGIDAGIYYCETVRRLSNSKYEWGYRKTSPMKFGFQEPAIYDSQMREVASIHSGHTFMLRCAKLYTEQSRLAKYFIEREEEIEKKISIEPSF